jgi:diguanylate cyclase (GGDEF)-like protein
MELTRLTTWLGRQSKSFILGIGVGLLLLLGLLDYLTGYELSVSLFYLLPITLVTWYAGRRSGLWFSLAGAVLWLAADVASGHHYTSPAYYLWNSLIRLGFFVIVTLLLDALHQYMHIRQVQARIDFLTGAANNRAFYEAARREIDRSLRYSRPLTLAYLDIDNFKAINDRFGHNAGDQVLQALVAGLQKQIRQTDILGRLGGDEFGLLLPETGGIEARAIIDRVRPRLLDEMRKAGWEVTFSMGVVTYLDPPDTTDELIRIADDLMYSVKESGRDGVLFATHEV